MLDNAKIKICARDAARVACMVTKGLAVLGILALMLCLSSTSADTEGRMTLLVYMTGADLESRAGAGSGDLAEMAAAAVDDSLTVAVLAGGAEQWHCGFPSDQNMLCRITSEGLQVIESTPANSMGDAATLSAFLKRGVACFPADRYGLILWDHGGGPLAGVCFDERCASDGLTLEELSAALSDSPFAETPLDFIGFDACLMATAEVANAVSPYAEFMIASQEPEPACGWNYSFLSGLGETEDGLAAGKLIVDAYAASQQESMLPTTLSCIRLSSMKALCSELDRLFSGLTGNLDMEKYARLAACRSDTKSLGAATPMDWDLVDLMDLADMLEEAGLADASSLRNAVKDTLACVWANEPYVCGMSIYSPFDNKEKYSSPWAVRYDALDFAPEYRAYVRAFADQWLGRGRISWRDTRTVQADTRSQRLSVALTDEQAADVSSARLLVLEKVDQEEYRLIYASPDLQPVNGQLSAVYRNEAMYLLDDVGNILCGPISWKPLRAASGIATYGLMETREWELQGFYLTWVPDENGTYEQAAYFVFNDALGIYTISENPLTPGDDINFGGYARRMQENVPFEQWSHGNQIRFTPVTFTGDTGWHLQLLPLESTKERVAMFEIIDLQANAHFTELMPLENTSAIKLLDTPVTCEDAGLSLTLEQAYLYTGANACLKLNLTLNSHRADPCKVNMEAVIMDSTSLLQFYSPWNMDMPAGGSLPMTLELDADDLQYCHIDRIETLQIILDIRENYIHTDTARYTFALPADLGMIVPPAMDMPEPLATFVQNGLRFDLTDLRFDSHGDLTGGIHLTNETNDEKRIQGINASVNGTFLTASLVYGGRSPFILPAGGETRFPFHIYLYTYSGEKRTAELEISDLSEIRRIDFYTQLEMDVGFEFP